MCMHSDVWTEVVKMTQTVQHTHKCCIRTPTTHVKQSQTYVIGKSLSLIGVCGLLYPSRIEHHWMVDIIVASSRFQRVLSHLEDNRHCTHGPFMGKPCPFGTGVLGQRILTLEKSQEWLHTTTDVDFGWRKCVSYTLCLPSDLHHQW